jgi:uncharacterized membrane protein
MLIAKELAVSLVAAMIIKCDNFYDFIDRLLEMVYAKMAVVLLAWLIFGNASLYVSFFALAMFVTFCLIDLEDIEERFDELKNL